jgi:DNA mismatch repair protein MutL
MELAEARVIGQTGGTFILVEAGDALLVIDQHAAHERVVFERLRRQWREAQVARQPLLFPVTVELTLQEAARVAAHQDPLGRLGLEVEPFGGGTVAVKALPTLLTGAEAGRLLLEVVDRLEEVGGAPGLDDRLDEVLAVMACHRVVRAHEPMSIAEIYSLLAAMDEAEFSGSCPHGRQVLVRIPFREMEKWFGR